VVGIFLSLSGRVDSVKWLIDLSSVSGASNDRVMNMQCSTSTVPDSNRFVSETYVTTDYVNG
jgi:hypothetical protein